MTKEESKKEELDQIEEKLIEEELKSRELPMPVSGKSVFEIKKRIDREIKKNQDEKG